MRTRRIIMAAAMWAATGVASANPFIQPDPNIQRGAAEQLAKKFGGLRGAISTHQVPAQPQRTLDPVHTHTIQQAASHTISRAMTPGEWLRAKEQEAARIKFGDLRLKNIEPAMPLSIALPAEAPIVPPAYKNRKVRVVYANNAPI